MHSKYSCGTSDHFSRRSFLTGATTGALSMLGFGGMVRPAAAEQLASKQKQVVVFWLGGGVSQLETWDPKPGTDTGGPFLPIETSAPGVQISELLPHTAKQMHNLALVRGINTKEGNHAKGDVIMQTGYRETPGFDYPYLGPAMASLLSPPNSAIPPHVIVQSKTDYLVDSRLPLEPSFLGPQYTAVALRGGNSPNNLALPSELDLDADARRRALRHRLGERFGRGRRTDNPELYDATYVQSKKLMERADLFDFGSLPEKDLDRYGRHSFGRDCLMARRLIEEGVTFVKVRQTDYDSHAENFNFHLEQLGEWDKPFSLFLSDLADRGLLETTLIIVMCEFGRTPKINQRVGRDHWGSAWSVAAGGCGIKGGAVVGKTNDNGTEVIDREVNGGHLFHTWYQAVGIDSTMPFYDKGRPFEKADPATSAITEILA